MEAIRSQTLTAGTLAGTGTFRCESCGFPVALRERDEIPRCPDCGEERFARQSIFARKGDEDPAGRRPVESPPWLADARDALVAAGDYLAFEDEDRIRVVQLQDGVTRLGRSLAAHLRFDDPTVSRRHALVQREEGTTKILDDRSLNGVFVNGERTDCVALSDGDELLVGRFRLYFIHLTGGSDPAADGREEPGG